MAKAQSVAGQYIVDVHTHFVRDDFEDKYILGLTNSAAPNWNPAIKDQKAPGRARSQVSQLRQGDVLRQRHPAGTAHRRAVRRPSSWLLTNEQIVTTRTRQRFRRNEAHALSFFHNAEATGLDGRARHGDLDRQAHSWKCYTIGDPLAPTKFPWRLDDEKLMYPVVREGGKGRDQHGLRPQGADADGLETSILADGWKYATVDDWGRPQRIGRRSTSSSIIRRCGHSSSRRSDSGRIRKTGYINWVSDLAGIPRSMESPTSTAKSARPSPRPSSQPTLLRRCRRGP